MSSSPTHPVHRLEHDHLSIIGVPPTSQGIEDLRTAVAGMTAEQVLSRPIPGKWSTLEVVATLPTPMFSSPTASCGHCP